MEIKRWHIILALSLALLCLSLGWMKGCKHEQSLPTHMEHLEEAIRQDRVVLSSEGRTYRLHATVNSNGDKQVVAGVVLKSNAESDVRNESNLDVSSEKQRSIQSSDGRIPLRELPARRDNIEWDTSTGDILWNKYGVSCAPGIGIYSNGTNPGLGIDIRGLYIGDFGLQIGAILFKEEKIKATISLGYNLRKTKLFRNTDLIVGIDHNKQIFGGIRIELGGL